MVFFDFEMDNMPLGGVSFELSTDHVPKTSGSFCVWGTGEKGSGPKGCCYLRVVLVFLCCHVPCWNRQQAHLGEKSEVEHFILKYAGLVFLFAANGGINKWFFTSLPGRSDWMASLLSSGRGR